MPTDSPFSVGVLEQRTGVIRAAKAALLGKTVAFLLQPFSVQVGQRQERILVLVFRLGTGRHAGNLQTGTGGAVGRRLSVPEALLVLGVRICPRGVAVVVTTHHQRSPAAIGVSTAHGGHIRIDDLRIMRTITLYFVLPTACETVGVAKLSIAVPRKLRVDKRLDSLLEQVQCHRRPIFCRNIFALSFQVGIVIRDTTFWTESLCPGTGLLG
mmetsp:Transcript_27080/g.44474  ORF Transcript_27080/g.44474 Transcript_27080/m.44474 type:complete len:212 (+) Transcript_27080:1030-1665(+)